MLHERGLVTLLGTTAIEEIEKLRNELYELIEKEKCLTCHSCIELSQKLDSLLNLYEELKK